MKYLWPHLLGLLFLINLPTFAAIKGEPVEYTSEKITLKGYLATDNSIIGQRPGILVVHEWWGHNEYARRRARMLAELGYTALAVDMYGEGKSTNHPKEATQFMKEVTDNMKIGQARFLAALEFLKKQETVDPNKVAAIGYCFGGGMVLAMARAGIDLDGVASFHGSLATKKQAQPGVVKAKVLVLHGEADQFVSPEQVKAFKEEMAQAKVDLEFVSYPGVKHSFTNPEADMFAEKFDLPVAYDESADKDSWAKLRAFFKRIFAE